MANCDDWFAGLTVPCLLAKGVTKVAVPAAQLISFGSDPAGYVAQKLQAGANGLATSVLPALKDATEPDLSTAWFLSTYKVSFGLAIFMWVILLIWNLLQYSRREVSGDDVVESFTVYSPIFIIGAVFGPVLAQFMIRFVGALTDGLIAWGLTKNAATTTKGLTALIGTGDPNLMVGGSFVAIGMYALMILALLMALVVLLVMVVTLYFSGAVFPMGWVWLTKAKDRSKGRKLVMVWGGVLFAQPLLFFMLGAALSLVTGSTFGTFAGQNGTPGLRTLVGLAVAAIALIIAATSPAMLLKFAPVGPTEASPGGPGLGKIPTSKRGGSGRGGAGESSDSNGQLAQIAQNNAQRSSGGGGGDSGGITAPSTGGSGGGLAQIGAGSGSGAAGAAGGTAAGGTAAAGAKAGAAGGPAGMAAGAAVAGAAGKAKEGAESASAAAGDAAGTAAAATSDGSGDGTAGSPGDSGPGEPAGLADAAGQSGAGSDSTGAAASEAGSSWSPPSSGEPVIPDAGPPEPVGGSLSDVTGAAGTGNSGSDAVADSTGAAAGGSGGGADDGGSWPAPTGEPVEPAQQSGGGFGQFVGQVASAAGGVASYAAKASNTVAGIAQTAAGHAEEQMDHHKDAPRAHR